MQDKLAGRQANYELLRIVAMAMVITSSLSWKGRIFDESKRELGISGWSGMVVRSVLCSRCGYLRVDQRIFSGGCRV